MFELFICVRNWGLSVCSKKTKKDRNVHEKFGLAFVSWQERKMLMCVTRKLGYRVFVP